MKKMLIVFAALLLILAVAAGCGSAQKPAAVQAEKTEEKAVEQAPPAGIPEGTRLGAMYVDLMKSGKYLIKYEAAYSIDNTDIQLKATVAFDQKNIDFTMESAQGTVHNLILDGVIYMINDADKSYMKLGIQEEMPEELGAFGNGDMTFIKSGTGTVEGKSLPYEEYDAAGQTVRYYFDGKKLSAIVAPDPSGDIVMRIIEFSDTIPAGMLKLPDGYTEAGALAIPQTPEIEDVSEEQLKQIQQQAEEMLKRQQQ